MLCANDTFADDSLLLNEKGISVQSVNQDVTIRGWPDDLKQHCNYFGIRFGSLGDL